MAHDALSLWSYNEITGVWKHERGVTRQTATQWLTVWKTSHPNTAFVVAPKKPSRPPKQDLTDATYLDKLGHRSSLIYADALLRQISQSERVVTLPLPVTDLQVLLDNTITGLTKMRQLDWKHTNGERQGAFTNAWYEGMRSKGLA